MATHRTKNMKPTALGEQAIALAERLGRIAGTIEGTAEQWLNRDALTDQLTRVRDGAIELLDTLASGTARGRQAAAGSTEAISDQVRRAASTAVDAAASFGSSMAKSARRSMSGRKSSTKGKSAAKGSRTSAQRADLAHAPGKRHRQPGPTVHGAKKSDERIPKLKSSEAARKRRKSYA